MLTGDFSTQAKLSQHLKDVRLILNAATSLGLELPMSQTHRVLLERAETAGYGELDNSAIMKVYQKTAPSIWSESAADTGRIPQRPG